MHTPREKLGYQVHTSLTEKERDKLNDACETAQLVAFRTHSPVSF